MAEEEVGKVFKFFVKPSVAAINATGDIKVGDKIHFKGANTDFIITIESMQIERESVESVTAGQSVGIKVPERVRPNDIVYRVVE
ncbi:MAG: translation elongation factor-like protein [Candidatus Hodarchaeota archaeon]